MANTIQSASPARHIFKAVLFCILFTGFLVLFSFFKGLLPTQFERFAHGIIGMAAAFLTTYLFLRIEKRTFADIGLRFEKTTLKKFAIGFLIGLGITILMFACLIVFGGMRLQLNQQYNVASFVLWTSAFLPLALMEEVAFRAYPLVTLHRQIGLWWSLIITSILFALYHVVNGWSLPISFLGPGVWALVYGLAAIYSKGIAMPTGIHYAANLTLAAIGMGKGFDSIWTLQSQDELTTVNRSEVTGYVIQIAFFLLVVAVIEWYRRKTTAKSGLAAVAGRPNAY